MGVARIYRETRIAIASGKLRRLLKKEFVVVYFKVLVAAFIDFEKNYTPKLNEMFEKAGGLIVDNFPATIHDYPARTTELGMLFTKHGSDKAGNGYDALYVELLKKRELEELVVVEVGIGSNDVRLPGNMGAGASFGAALFALAEFLPNSRIIGADIDPKCVEIRRERITCVWVDQTRRESFRQLQTLIESKADLIIVDGLHSPLTEINTLLELMHSLNSGGSLVIEDIGHNSIPFYLYLQSNFDQGYRTEFFRFINSYVFVVTAQIS